MLQVKRRESWGEYDARYDRYGSLGRRETMARFRQQQQQQQQAHLQGRSSQQDLTGVAYEEAPR